VEGKHPTKGPDWVQKEAMFQKREKKKEVLELREPTRGFCGDQEIMPRPGDPAASQTVAIKKTEWKKKKNLN